MIPIASPVIGDEERAAVLRVLESGVLAQGPVVEAFEKEFAERLGVRHAVAVGSGSAALLVALLSHGVGEGDEVITTPFSFIASANAVLFAGARPRFVDVRDDDFNIDPALIERMITPRTKAIIPVHLYGNPCRMDDIETIARRHGLTIIEDCCQAHGASIEGRPVGSFGTACYSFYPTKNMTTGEGGMVTTDDADVAAQARMLRNHGQSERYLHERIGFNWRMTDLAAAIGLAQLDRLEEGNALRRANARRLNEGCAGVVTPPERECSHHVYHQYTVRVPGQRDELLSHLREHGVGAVVYYPMPIHRQPVYRRLGYRDDLPVAERLSTEVLSLPVHPSLTEGSWIPSQPRPAASSRAGRAGGAHERRSRRPGLHGRQSCPCLLRDAGSESGRRGGHR